MYGGPCWLLTALLPLSHAVPCCAVLRRAATECAVGFNGTTCELCLPGRGRTTVGLVLQRCYECPAGTYSPGGLANETDCLPCANGATTSTAGLVSCTPCPQGFFSTGGAACQACPDNSTTLVAGSDACTGVWRAAVGVLQQAAVLHNVTTVCVGGGAECQAPCISRMPRAWLAFVASCTRVCAAALCYAQHARLALNAWARRQRPAHRAGRIITRNLQATALAHLAPTPVLSVLAQHHLQSALVSSLFGSLMRCFDST